MNFNVRFPTQYTPETNLTWLLTEIASDWTSVGLTSKVIQDISKYNYKIIIQFDKTINYILY